MLWVVGALTSLLSFAWARGLNVFDVANGLFGSLVAVTGDAHQAQVAQVRTGRVAAGVLYLASIYTVDHRIP